MSFAILIAGEPDDDVIDRKGTFEDMFLQLLREEGEEWRLYFVFRGEFPSEEELAGLDGFVITGSVGDAFGQEEWLVKLRATVRQAASMEKRVLGVCFGHQLVGTAYNGKVGRAGFFECGAREVAVHKQACAAVGAPWALELAGLGGVAINECHQDQVLEVPEGATVLASSDRCPIEMFAVGSNVLGIQGHPEFDSEVVLMLTDNRRHLIAAEDLERRNASYQALRPADQAAQLQRVCRAFLKGRA